MSEQTNNEALPPALDLEEMAEDAQVENLGSVFQITTTCDEKGWWYAKAWLMHSAPVDFKQKALLGQVACTEEFAAVAAASLLIQQWGLYKSAREREAGKK